MLHFLDYNSNKKRKENFISRIIHQNLKIEMYYTFILIIHKSLPPLDMT